MPLGPVRERHPVISVACFRPMHGQSLGLVWFRQKGFALLPCEIRPSPNSRLSFGGALRQDAREPFDRGCRQKMTEGDTAHYARRLPTTLPCRGACVVVQIR